jgi:DNA-binding NtrC family response regulator
MAKNKTILIVDDDIDLLNMLKILLLNQNCKVICAGNGKAAKEIIELHEINLIITDFKCLR